VLQSEIDTLRNDRIALDTIVTDTDTSMLIAGLSARIKSLEEKVVDLDNRKEYE